MRERNVIVECQDDATALACYRNSGHRAAKTIRNTAAEVDFVVIEYAA